MSKDDDMLSAMNQSILLPQSRAVTTAPMKTATSDKKVHVARKSNWGLIGVLIIPFMCLGLNMFNSVICGVYLQPVERGSAIFPTQQMQNSAPSTSTSDMEISRQSDVLLTVVKGMYKSQSQESTSVLHDQLADARSAFTPEGFRIFSQEMNGLSSLIETVEDGKQVSLLSYDIPIKGDDPHSMTMRVILSRAGDPTHYKTATFRAIFLPTQEGGRGPLLSSLSLNID